jgi:hypothetical protein
MRPVAPPRLVAPADPVRADALALERTGLLASEIEDSLAEWERLAATSRSRRRRRDARRGAKARRADLLAIGYQPRLVQALPHPRFVDHYEERILREHVAGIFGVSGSLDDSPFDMPLGDVIKK